MFSIGPVYTRDNGPGVSGAEPEYTARYRDLLHARAGEGYHRSRTNIPRACAYPAGITRGVGMLVHPMESLVAAR